MNNFINIPNKIKTSLIVAIVIKLNPEGGGATITASGGVGISCRRENVQLEQNRRYAALAWQFSGAEEKISSWCRL